MLFHSLSDITSLDPHHNEHMQDSERSERVLFSLLLLLGPSIFIPFFFLCLKYSDPLSPVTWVAGRPGAQMHFSLFWAALGVLDCVGMTVKSITADLTVARPQDPSPMSCAGSTHVTVRPLQDETSCVFFVLFFTPY